MPTTTSARYDTLVLGGGMARLPLALRAARHGRVALVERGKLGGTCLNRGCIPTKTMIASATVAHQVRTAAAFGVEVAPPTVHPAAVVDAATDRILGCHIAGQDAGDLVHGTVIAMVAGAAFSDVARAIHIHPTLAEGVNAAAGGVHRPATG
jgi:pyruvate/2-oxoglutarate dehydrogenase complex dihydrolipoamide dehydrogenase (E3) component